MTWQDALKRVVKPRNIIFIIILLVVNTFAWFVYTNQVSNNMTAHVRGWKVIFEAGDNAVEDYVEIDVENMFPGMEEFEYVITAHNRSEVKARLSFMVMEANIMGDEYITVERRRELNEEAVSTDLTSAELLEKITDDYPFKIAFSVTKAELAANEDQSEYKINVVWPFESGVDSEDTYWGKRSADYKEDNPDLPSITLTIKITITQAI